MSKTAIEASRGTHFLVDPEKLFLVRDEKHALYDPRVERGISDEMVASILSRGVIEPIIARKNGEKIEVIDGRQRTLNAIEANKRLRAQGAPTISVPVILRKDDDADAAEISVTLNEIRKGDDIITKAEKAKRLSDMGKSDGDIARAFGVSSVSVKTWLRVLDLAPAVRAAIRKGEITASDAVKELADLERDEQIKLLEKLKNSGSTLRGKKTTAGDGEANKPKKTSAVSRLRLLYRDENALETLTGRERAIIDWIFGTASDGDLVEKLPRLADFVEEAKKGRRAQRAKELKAAKGSEKKTKGRGSKANDERAEA